MILAKLLTVGAIVLGGAMVGVSNDADITPIPTKGNLTEYYFQFTGSNGQESNALHWEQITQNEYDASACTGDYRGCTLITTSVATTAGELHPTQVIVDQDPNDPTNQSPEVGAGVIEVQNKAMSY